MKQSKLLSLTNQFQWLPVNIATLVVAAIVLTTGVVAFQKNLEAKTPDAKSVAWYTANPKEARAQNQACFENPALQATENCVNSLHALEISYKGSNT
jgi:hypothetical protein